jgi:hypothetical protein
MPRKSSAQLDREIAEALTPREGMRVVVTASGSRKHGLREGAHGLIARVASADARKGKPSSTARVLVSVHGAEFATDWPTASLRVAGKGEIDPQAMPASESSYLGGLRYKAGLKGSHATKKPSGTEPYVYEPPAWKRPYIPGQEYEFATVDAIKKRIEHLKWILSPGRYQGPGRGELATELEMLEHQWLGNALVRERQMGTRSHAATTKKADKRAHATKKVSSQDTLSERKQSDFVEYLLSFYGKDGLYGPSNSNPIFPQPMSKKEAVRAAKIVGASKDFDGDSFDREKARDLVLSWRDSASKKSLR